MDTPASLLRSKRATGVRREACAPKDVTCTAGYGSDGRVTKEGRQSSNADCTERKWDVKGHLGVPGVHLGRGKHGLSDLDTTDKLVWPSKVPSLES